MPVSKNNFIVDLSKLPRPSMKPKDEFDLQGKFIASAFCWWRLRRVPMIVTPPTNPDYQFAPEVRGWGECLGCGRVHALKGFKRC